MSLTPVRRRRPFGVTILIVFLWIQAIIGIVGGILLIVFHHDHSLIHNSKASSSDLLGYGIGALVVGLITAWIASAIGRGSNFARWFIGFISLLHLAGAIYGFIRIHSSERYGSAADGIIALIVLYILFGERGSREFFTGRR